jgi:hypothetical protein
MILSRDYLMERVTVEDVLETYDFDTCHPEFRADWERLLSKKIDGDDLYNFAPPPRRLQVWGVALVRRGEVISTLVECVS